MTEPPTFITVDDARATIVQAMRPLGAERVTLRDAAGRRLAAPIIAPSDSPAFTNSAMDGFAFRHAGATKMTVVGVSAAGAPFVGTVEPGQAIRIMTGAPVPHGCDTVAMREHCEVDGDELTVANVLELPVGANVRKQGEYARAGEPAIPRGTLLGPAELGLAAGMGRAVVEVVRSPRVAILATGTELVEPDQVPGDGQIYNSNSYMLEALVRDSGGAPTVSPSLRDDLDATRTAILDLAATADLVITVGGVSAGDYDFVRDVLQTEGDGMEFWKVKMKPGKPLAFGRIGARRVPVIGLPGNPISSFVGFQQFVRPALAVLQGANAASAVAPRLRIATTQAIRSTPYRREFVVGHISTDGEARFVPHDKRSSGNTLALLGCHAFAVFDVDDSGADAGGLVDVELLGLA